MILRRYGKNYLSVTPNFDSRAMTEIGFMRDGEVKLEVDAFGDRYELVETRELAPHATGDVQGEVEEAVLRDLENEVSALAGGLTEGMILVVENEQGVDHPKTRGKQASVSFEYTVDPPLRIGIYRSK